jgi:hypothetical protein
MTSPSYGSSGCNKDSKNGGITITGQTRRPQSRRKQQLGANIHKFSLNLSRQIIIEIACY